MVCYFSGRPFFSDRIFVCEENGREIQIETEGAAFPDYGWSAPSFACLAAR